MSKGETEATADYGADSPWDKALYTADSWTDASSPCRLKMGPDRKRHLLSIDLCSADDRSNVLLFDRTRTEDTVLIWIAESHFFRATNTLYNP